MPTFNPFTSQEDLLGFLQQTQEGQSYNEREEALDNPIADFKLQQQESGVTPMYTNDPKMRKELDAYYVESQKPVIQTALELEQELFNFESVDNEFDAERIAEDIRSRVRNTARDLEKQIATDLGLFDLQKQHAAMMAIPGALDFESTRNRIQQVEAQIAAKESELRQKLRPGANGLIEGDLSDDLNKALDLANNWDIRKRELAQLNSLSGSERSMQNSERVLDYKAEKSLGGKEAAQAIADAKGVTYASVLDMQTADQLSPAEQAYGEWVATNGRTPTLEEAMYTFEDNPDIQTYMINNITREIPELSATEIKTMYKQIAGGMSVAREQALKELYGENTEKTLNLSKDEEKMVAARAKAISIQNTLTGGKTLLKEKNITSDDFDISLRMDVPQITRTAATALRELAPNAFKYYSDPKKAVDAINEAAEMYAKMQQSNPGTMPRFAEVMMPMLQQMRVNFNSKYKAIDPMMLSVDDQSLQDQQLAILKMDAKLRYPTGIGAGIADQATGVVKNIADKARSLFDAIPNPMANPAPAPAPAPSPTISMRVTEVPAPISMGVVEDPTVVDISVLPESIQEFMMRNGMAPAGQISAKLAAAIIRQTNGGADFDPNDPMAGRKLQYLIHQNSAAPKVMP